MNSIQPNPLQNTRSADPSAAKLARGVDGKNLEASAEAVAQESAMISDGLGHQVQSCMAADTQSLRMQLWARLSDDQMATSMMAAGALLGPGGVVFPDLAKSLHGTVTSREKLDALAEKIKTFGERQPGESPQGPDVFVSLNNRVTSHLVKDGVKPANVPLALFISGAVANAMQDHGDGYYLAP